MYNIITLDKNNAYENYEAKFILNQIVTEVSYFTVAIYLF